MATVIIEVVLGKLGEITVEQVANQASLLLNFRKDFKWLRRKLTNVRAYLQYADDLHMKNNLVKKWLADVQDMVFDAEDIVEECVVQHHDSFIFRYMMGRRIKKLKARMKLTMKDADHLNLVQQVFHVCKPLTSHGNAERWKKSGLVERDARPVAIHAKVEQILHLLEGDAFQVIAVVGMGGIGKTFLLQNVYNHHKVRHRFDKLIWLSISQVYSVARLQYDIASHLDLLDVKAGGVTEQRAAELIHQKLRDKSSFIVLDDVWSVEGIDNLMQRLGIPGCPSHPCKVVVTTRSIEVCNIMGASQIYHMELLSEEDSWNLFRFHAFPNDQQNSPSQELDEVAHQVEKQCGRLPLAIKTVAASMASQKLLSTWESKLQQLKEVIDPEDPFRPILRLSYDALPAVLKPCFLYFYFFGEDVEIDAEYLIYLWIGEGFIPEGKEQWSTGWSYLKQLTNLCLVEVSQDVEVGEKQGWMTDKLKQTCQIHDLLLDLIINICKENNCAFSVEEALRCRRIFLAKKGLDDASISRMKCRSSLRTLSLSQNTISELPTKSLTGLRALRVLDLSHTYISVLPSSIGNLKLLRVLNLSNTGFRKVPDCVRNLKSLSFLDVSTCPLPKWIGDLQCLQHIQVRCVDYSREISRGLSKLVSLRTLRLHPSLPTIRLHPVWTLARNSSRLVLKDVAKLIHLQELCIDIANEEERRSLEEGFLAQLVNMRHLTITYTRNNLLAFPEKMKAMRELEYLVLYGFKVSRWMCQYGNLRVLELWRCDFSQCPALETMPNLLKLKLEGCGRCEELPESFGKSGAFPQLRSFVIQGFIMLKKLPDLEDGAMPRVEVFMVNFSRILREIPEGFEHLRSLKLLDLEDNYFRDDERERLKEGGEYWNKIKGNNFQVIITM